MFRTISTYCRTRWGSLVKLVKEDKGAAMIEYSILIGLIAAAVILIILFVSGWITQAWQALQTALTSAGTPGG